MNDEDSLREPVWNEDLVCNWYGLIVVEPSQVALVIKPHNSTDMTGAIKVATAVMPDVRVITVAAAGTGAVDVTYRFESEEWQAFNSRNGAVLKVAQTLR